MRQTRPRRKPFKSRGKGDTYAKQVGKEQQAEAEAKRKAELAKAIERHAELQARLTEGQQLLKAYNCRIHSEASNRQMYHELRLTYQQETQQHGEKHDSPTT